MRAIRRGTAAVHLVVPVPAPCRDGGAPRHAAAILALAALALLVAALPVSADPTLRWADVHDDGGVYYDYVTAVLADPNGDLIEAGEAHDPTEGSDMLIRRLARATADTLWTARYSAADGNDMALTGLAWDPFGDVLVGGYIRGCVG